MPLPGRAKAPADDKEVKEMVSKQEERKALEQIRGIVNALGADSYIATAFAGCFEIAEDNIENDFARSMKDRAESAEFAEDTLRRKVAELQERIKGLEEKLAAEKRHVALEQDYARQGWDKASEMTAKVNELNDSLLAADDKATAQEQEIMRLKARLCDLLVK